MIKIVSILKASLTSIAILSISTFAFAQSNFTDKEIDGFVKAQQKVAEIAKKNEEAMKDRGKAFQKVQKKMVGAIQDTSISVNKYNEIMAALKTDKDLSKRIQKAMQ